MHELHEIIEDRDASKIKNYAQSMASNALGLWRGPTPLLAPKALQHVLEYAHANHTLKQEDAEAITKLRQTQTEPRQSVFMPPQGIAKGGLPPAHTEGCGPYSSSWL